MSDRSAGLIYASGPCVRYTPGVETIEEEGQDIFQAIAEER